MTQEELIAFLKQNLKIELDDYHDGRGNLGIIATLKLGNEGIYSSTFILEYK